MAGHNRKGNLKGNTQSTRNSIPAEERVELKQKIIDAKIRGASFYEIADKHNIAWETAKKLFWEALAEAGDSEDPSLVLRKERMRLEQIVDKGTRDYHAN